MADKRCDMSATCGMHYDEYWRAVHVDHTMSEDYFLCWFDRNCAKCTYMSEICMHGEGAEQPEESGSKEDDSATTPSDPSSGETRTTTSPASADSIGSQEKTNLQRFIPHVDFVLNYLKESTYNGIASCPIGTLDYDGDPDNKPSMGLYLLWSMCVVMFGEYAPSSKPLYGCVTDVPTAIALLEFIKAQANGGANNGKE